VIKDERKYEVRQPGKRRSWWGPFVELARCSATSGKWYYAPRGARSAEREEVADGSEQL
jgi:hypothetical protein